MKKENIKIIYHRVDMDGHASAAIIAHHFKWQVTFVPYTYGDEINEQWFKQFTSKDMVYVVDVIPHSIENMIKLTSMVARLNWIDHHKTSYNRYLELKDKFDHKKLDVMVEPNSGIAACQLTWKFMQGLTATPYGIELLGWYDVWDKEYEAVDFFQYGTRKVYDINLSVDHPENVKYWDNVFSKGQEQFVHLILNMGVDELERIKNVNIEKMKTSREGIIELADGSELNCIISDNVSGSMAFESVYKSGKHNVMVALKAQLLKGIVIVSLYGIEEDIPEIDLSEIAKSFGGGGHRYACGFEVPMQQLFNIIKLREI